MIFRRLAISGFCICIQMTVHGQSTYEKQPALLGVHFTLQDFVSGKWGGKFSPMAPGVSVSYLKGIDRKIDFGFSAGAAFPDSMKTTIQQEQRPVMIHAGLSGRIRAFSYPRNVQPFIWSGLEGTIYNEKFSAFLTPGLGLQVSYHQVSLIVQTGYGWELSGSLGNKFFYSAGIAGLIKTSKGKRKLKPVDAVAIIDQRTVAINSDRDHDGIPDSLDQCPQVPGDRQFAGCPDSDGDGIRDSDDQCPHQAGATVNGCPLSDRDQDGIPDDADKCPDQMGFANNQGCPVEAEKTIVILENAAAAIYFETASYNLLPTSYPALQRVDSLLHAQPGLQLIIEGHTDNQGNEKANLLLSKNRATAVMNYLVNKGHTVSRFTATGYGAAKPVGSNQSPDGRQRNRRVVMRIKE